MRPARFALPAAQALLASALAWGHPAGPPAPGQGAPPGAAEGASPPAPEELARVVGEYLASKGWQEGENPTLDPARRVVVAVGTGVIDAPAKDPGWAAARIAAARQAMLDAERRLAKHLGQAIARAAVLRAVNKAPGDDLSTAAAALLDAPLGRILREQGVDPASADPATLQRTVEDAVAKRAFVDQVEAVANAHASGLCAFKTFEGLQPDGRGEIRVVVVWSDFMRRMAEAMRGAGQPPSEQPRSRLQEQVPGDAQLVATFGVQPRVDERGAVWLLAFGQAPAPAGGSDKSAFDAAELAADGELRSFAGELVSVVERGGAAGVATRAASGERSFSDRSSFEQLVTTRAAALTLKGVSTLAQRRIQHPITGVPICVVVRMWSPSAANLAAMAGGGAGGAGGAPGGAAGNGATGDDDATGTRR